MNHGMIGWIFVENGTHTICKVQDEPQPLKPSALWLLRNHNNLHLTHCLQLICKTCLTLEIVQRTQTILKYWISSISFYWAATTSPMFLITMVQFQPLRVRSWCWQFYIPGTNILWLRAGQALPDLNVSWSPYLCDVGILREVPQSLEAKSFDPVNLFGEFSHLSCLAE